MARVLCVSAYKRLCRLALIRVLTSMHFGSQDLIWTVVYSLENLSFVKFFYLRSIPSKTYSSHEGTESMNSNIHPGKRF